MKAIISVLSGERVDYHSTEIFEDDEIEEIYRSNSLPENRLLSVIDAVKLSHKDYDLRQITEILVSVMDNGIEKKCSCDKSLEFIKELGWRL